MRLSLPRSGRPRPARCPWGRWGWTRVEVVGWTFLDPSEPDPPPRTCHGRDELAWALRRQARQGLTSQIEEITARGEQVLVVIHTPGVDQTRARQAGDRNYLVLTLRDGRIIAIRACRDDREARQVAGLA